MTRANILIISDGNKFKLRIGSDGYPADVLPILIPYKDARDYYELDLRQFVIDLGLTLGHIGNPCYYYDLNLDDHWLKAWKSTMYWVNAPENWRERGWNCHLGGNGKYGYENWRKGILVYDSSQNPRYYQDSDGLYTQVPERAEITKEG